MATPPSAAPDDALDRIAGLLAAGDAAAATHAAAELRAHFPRDAEATRLHAIALLQQGRVEDARLALLAALDLAPRSIEVLTNLGSVLLRGGDAAAAVVALERAAAMAPDHPAVQNGLGTARRALGDLAGARNAYARSTRTLPDYAGAWMNLAACELELGLRDDAERTARHAVSVSEGHPEARFVLGNVLDAQGRHAEAEAVFAAAARMAPNDARFPYQVGLMREQRKELTAAADAYAHALAIDPHFDRALGQLTFLRRQLCDWHDLDTLSARFRARVAAGARGLSSFAFLSEPASAAEQLQCARNAAVALPGFAPAESRAAATVGERLRVGFLSNGFGNHPTGLLIVAMLEALHEHPLDVHLIATRTGDASTIERRLRAAATHWHDAQGLAPRALAAAIAAVDVDILIDLRDGHDGSAADALSLRPAPLQVAWLAHPGTTGAPWIDVVIADRIVLPESMAQDFSESVAWLPRCYQPTDTTRAIAPTPSRAACGLADDAVVFVCFNNSYKLNPGSFARMLAILREVPDSVLWLLSGPEGADGRLRIEAQRRGVDATRLVFMPKLAHADYLARYANADCFLDTTPYNAHTTASDALWAGCPLLTSRGETFAARVAASINHHLGMPDMIADDDAAFIARAIEIGRDATLRAALRARVAERRRDSGLFDMRGFAADFHALLATLAQRPQTRASLPSQEASRANGGALR